jgi:hypothetical protein
MSFYVYEIWDPLKNEPFYVGKGTMGSSISRYQCHLRDALRSEDEFHSHKDRRIRKIFSLGAEPLCKIVFETPR